MNFSKSGLSSDNSQHVKIKQLYSAAQRENRLISVSHHSQLGVFYVMFVQKTSCFVSLGVKKRFEKSFGSIKTFKNFRWKYWVFILSCVEKVHRCTFRSKQIPSQNSTFKTP